MWWLLLVPFLWVAYAGGIGWYVAEVKGRPIAEGIILGILAGPAGWLIVAVLPRGRTRAVPMTDDGVEAEWEAIAAAPWPSRRPPPVP